jgi:recombinational DNA repair protein (RecF pathway)
MYMQEYVSEAIVLDKMPQGDLDNRLFLFTKRFGKLVAKAKSGRKITSKLSPHLQPGNVAFVRLIEKNGLQVGDALKADRVKADIPDLAALNAMLSESEPDEQLWQALLAKEFNWQHILKILGWDPAGASCGTCDQAPTAFHVGSQDFFCGTCASKFDQNEVIYI